MMFMLLYIYRIMSMCSSYPIELGQVRANNLFFFCSHLQTDNTCIIHLFSLLGFIRTISYEPIYLFNLNTI